MQNIVLIREFELLIHDALSFFIRSQEISIRSSFENFVYKFIYVICDTLISTQLVKNMWNIDKFHRINSKKESLNSTSITFYDLLLYLYFILHNYEAFVENNDLQLDKFLLG